MEENSESAVALPEEQIRAIELLARARQDVDASANSLAASQILASRDTALAVGQQATNWNGTVVGVQEMQGKAAIGIDAGGFEVVAGVNLTYGFDTLIPPSQTRLYDRLLSLQSGDEVVFSGNFALWNDAVVELSYTDAASKESPRFLFQFTDIYEIK